MGYFANLVGRYKGFLKWSWPMLKHLQFWRYCTISLSSKSLCFQITAEVSKITKSVSCNLVFIFIELSGAANSFLKIRLALKIKNVASIIKRRFYWKRGCIKMYKYAKTFDIKKGCKLPIFVFIPTWLFWK